MKKQNKYIIIIVAAGIVNLLLLYLLKYSTNSLSFSDFSLFKTGNLISFVFTVILFTGSLMIRSDQSIHIGHLRTLSSLSFIYLVPLISLLIFNSLSLEFKDDFFIGYPLKKIIPVLFYIINQLIFIFVAFSVWYLYAKHSLLAYFYSVLSIVVLILFFMIIAVVYTYFVGEYRPYESDKKHDYGIVLGAAVWSNNKPSPIFAGRIERAADLYKNNRISKIQLTGGNAPGEVSEAVAAKNYLTEKYRVDLNDIYLEEATATTNEQIRFIKKEFMGSDVEVSLIIISDDFHLKRIEEMLDFYEINANVISSEYKLNFQKSLYYRIRDSVGLILFWLFAI